MQSPRFVALLFGLFCVPVGALELPAVLTDQHQRAVRSEVLARPVHQLPDFASLSDAALAEFFALGKTEGLVEASPALEIPSAGEVEANVQSALDYLDRNRSADHKKKYRLVVDRVPALPKEGFLVFQQSGEGPGELSRELWVVPIVGQRMVYFSEAQSQGDAMEAIEPSAFKLGVFAVENEVRDRMVAMLWNLAHVKSELAGASGGVNEPGVYDGVADLSWHDGTVERSIYSASRWFTLEGNMGQRWTGPISSDVAATWSGEFLSEHGGRLLSQRCGVEPIHFMRWASSAYSEVDGGQTIEQRELALKKLMGLVELGQVPDVLVCAAAKLTMSGPYEDWRSILKSEVQKRMSVGENASLLAAERALELAEAKVSAELLAPLMADGGDYSAWANEQLAKADAGLQLEVYYKLWELSDQAPWVLRHMAEQYPEQSRAMYFGAADLAQQMAVFVEFLANEDELKQGQLIDQLIRRLNDRTVDAAEKARLLGVFACDRVALNHPESFEFLTQWMRSVDSAGGLDVSLLYSEAFKSALAYPQAGKQFADMLLKLEHVAIEPNDEKQLLEAICSFAIAGDLRADLVSYLERRLLNNAGCVDVLVHVIMKYDVQELAPVLARMATRGSDEAQSVLAVTGLSGDRYPSGNFSFHLARQSRVLWEAVDGGQKPRVLGALAQAKSDLFFDEKPTVLGERVLEFLRTKTQGAQSLELKLEQSGSENLKALLKDV